MSVVVDVPASVPLGLPAECCRPSQDGCSCVSTLLAWTASVHGVLAGLGVDDPDVAAGLAMLSAYAMRSAGVRYSRRALEAVRGKAGWLPDLVSAIGEGAAAEVIDAFISASRSGDEATLRRVARVVLDALPGTEGFKREASRIIEEGGFEDLVALVAYMLFLEPCEG